MVTRPGRMVTYLEGLLTIKSFHCLIIGLQGQGLNKNNYISTTRVFMATKLGRMITYLLPINSHDSLITWSYEII